MMARMKNASSKIEILRNVSSRSRFGADLKKPVDIPVYSILTCHVEAYAGVFGK
jgi:hypothetical protein